MGGFALGGLTLPHPGPRGDYDDNLTRTGAPVATAIDESISTDTLDNGTAGVWESFSVEWAGAIVIPRSGRYRFATISDDGSELEIDRRTIVHSGGQHGPQQANGTIAPAAGVHAIRVRYEQDGGGFARTILSAREQAPLQPISSSLLLPDPVTTTQYLWRLAVPALTAVVAIVVFAGARRVFARRALTVRTPWTWAQSFEQRGVALALVIAVAVVARILMMLGSQGIRGGTRTCSSRRRTTSARAISWIPIRFEPCCAPIS